MVEGLLYIDYMFFGLFTSFSEKYSVFWNLRFSTLGVVGSN